MPVVNVNKILAGVLIIIALFIATETLISVIPWYEMRSVEISYPDGQKAFKPGEIMDVIIVRKALIETDINLIRELIKINEFSDEMIYRVHEHYGAQRGLRTSIMHLQVPTLKMAPSLAGNSYIWRGTLTYRPLGMLEKTMTFQTEKFHIEVGENRNAD